MLLLHSSPMRSPKNAKAFKGTVFEDKFSPAPATRLAIGIPPAIVIASEVTGKKATEKAKPKANKRSFVKRWLKGRAPAPPPKSIPPPSTLRASVMMGIINDQQWKLDEMEAEQERIIQVTLGPL